MDEATEARVRLAAVPLCEKFLGTAFGVMDVIQPLWKERGIDLGSSQYLYATVLFNFAAIPLVLTSRAVHMRFPTPVADRVTDILNRTYVWPLVNVFLERAGSRIPRRRSTSGRICWAS